MDFDRWLDLWLFILSAFAGVGAWYVKTVSDDITTLRGCVHRLATQIASDGVRTESAGDRLRRIEGKLDSIIDQLGRKVDRDDCVSFHWNHNSNLTK